MQDLRAQMEQLRHRYAQYLQKCFDRQRIQFAILGTKFQKVPLVYYLQKAGQQLHIQGYRLRHLVRPRWDFWREKFSSLTLRLHNLSLDAQLKKGYWAPLNEPLTGLQDYTQLTPNAWANIAHRSGIYRVQVQAVASSAPSDRFCKDLQ
jgi:exonuclease VII large subunit